MEPLLTRLPKDDDLLAALTRTCGEQGIRKGQIQVIGALQRARLGYYHQDAREYEDHDFNQHCEILAGIGNVSILDGEIMVHLHLTLGREDCSAFGGHAMPGCVIFAAEAYIRPVTGPDLVREWDEATGLKLWAG